MDYLQTILTGQFQAALSMLDHCIRACPPEHWDGKIAIRTFGSVAYHTLFWLDVYLSPGDEDAFELRELHRLGGDEREPVICPGLSRDDTLVYVPMCRQKIRETFAAETAVSMQGPSGFAWRKITRGELHLYNLRHVQHHTGQLSAYLRRVNPALDDDKILPWIESGWR
jgi:hypothetical protein